ncbi:MAG: C4-dicarboxylate ABC transporter substrate-binding protein [Rhodobacteraceae bacterium]|jgi:TRAP-type mannitol/chloroaromatic compound transport system substrate-binding protein|uniref:TRAP-type mannitol/chloroaromatic compound transport system, periplasmic component n=1 Tax=Salipiger profundus TaxID=1229727 RepID=A0A1U7D5R7_9RHOB|nr:MULTISPECIES: TRAP transporter substrate-binding protein [Salipiger]MAB07980.1 C4-dicarboxylate ABC transporter substrate-binding protein [Paracoccaceae bacterium]APX23491.1 TRAP-type mannitol/chloroaromatic compound transport system, periplasmic component [Salipiger profundus]MBB94322.1 C4-dicarboxylate ABC transporter substrate-binding protein [Paracoccaceae bacterium]SFC87236.1 TRAP-type mannitol/chloroaromatic compound transport system, substrate-binding protein [Salipiger profundus]GGA
MNRTTLKTGIAALALLAGTAASAETLRIQTYIAPETISGRNAQAFVEDVATMSDGDLTIDMFFSSSVVKSVEGWDASVNGIIDCDMTQASYQTGKDPGFQFLGDIMGGYETPWQQYAWLYERGGLEIANELYNEYGMQLVGWWLYGPESMSSTTPLAGVEDLKDWKFRSPPGMETEIFAKLGASPVVMDFNEIFTALETGIIDGADASGLANNVGLGLYDVAGYATFPGFHSMPSDHLACNKTRWDGLSEKNKRIMSVAMHKLGMRTTLAMMVANETAAKELEAEGVTLHNWGEADRSEFRKAARDTWEEWAQKSPAARKIVDSHVSFMTELGLIEPSESN